MTFDFPTDSCQPFILPVALHRLSMAGILQQQLWAALPANLSAHLLPVQIPLYRLKHPTAIIYRSPLPRQLANRQSLPLLLEKLAEASCPASSPSLLAFAVQSEESHLDFHLQELSLAIWLQQLPQQLAACQQTEKQEFKEIKANIFPIQYGHARCCSLLRLAHREGLIRLGDFPFCQWQWLDPEPIPWLTPEGKFSLVQPAERRVIRQLLAVCDALDRWQPSPSPNWRQLATALRIAFCQFEAECRIFGEIGRKNPDLSRSRLGLIAITQLLLRVLLEDRLGIAAPQEL